MSVRTQEACALCNKVTTVAPVRLCETLRMCAICMERAFTTWEHEHFLNEEEREHLYETGEWPDGSNVWEMHDRGEAF